MTTQTNPSAPDSSLESRPGVPRRQKAEPMGHAHWSRPERQTDGERILRDVQRTVPTAIFSDAQPPRGLSGMLRRKAYQLPDYRARRWLLLMVADRIDALEYRWSMTTAAQRAGVAALGLIGLGVLSWRRDQRAQRLAARLER